jgi:hypothetical protein
MHNSAVAARAGPPPDRLDQLVAGLDQVPGPFLGVQALLQVEREPGAAAGLEPAHLGVRDGAGPTDDRPQRPQVTHVAEVPEPGADDVAGLLAPPGAQGDEGLDQGGHQRLRQYPEEVE